MMYNNTLIARIYTPTIALIYPLTGTRILNVHIHKSSFHNPTDVEGGVWVRKNSTLNMCHLPCLDFI